MGAPSREGGAIDESQLGGLAFIAVGGAGILAALVLYLRGRRFLATALSAQGTVVENVASSGDEGGTVYQPVIDFTAADGQQVRFTGSVASSPPKYQPGQVVTVKYSPTNPQKAKLPGIFGMWFLPLLFGTMGIGFAGGGVLWLNAGPSSDEGAAAPGVVTSVAPPVQSISPGLPGMPGVSSVFTIQDGSGAGRVANSTCEAFRKGGKKVREAELGFEDQTLTLRLKPFTGPGPYLPGQSVRVGGSFFEGPVSGAVIVDETGTGGVVNLVAGSRSVSGAWNCSET